MSGDFDELDFQIHSSRESNTGVRGSAKKNNPLLRFLPIIIPVVIVAVLVVSVLPSFFRHKEQYEEAMLLLYSQQYEDARTAFTLLGNYRDSGEQAAKNVDYVHACDILSEADKDDVETLEKARAMFASLDGYRDSAEMMERIERLEEEHREKLLREEYDSALALLKSERYVSASEAFKKLGSYGDCETMVKECYYLRAEKLYSKIEELSKSDQLRGVYVSLNPDGEDYKITVTGIPTENEKPICKAASEEYGLLGDYKDSRKKSEAAEEYGDFTKEFYRLCEAGDLTGALSWLSKYNDDIPDRESYIERLNRYLKYITTWGLKSGDPTLAPWAAGVSGSTYDISTRVTVEEDGDFLVIDGNDLQFELKMKATDDGRGFTFTADEVTYYYVTINQVNNFAFMKYDSAGHLTGSSEYVCH